MIYHCDRCQAVLPGGVTLCPRCGRQFEQAVPTDTPAQSAEMSMDALLRRSASGAGGFAPGGSPAIGAGQIKGPGKRQIPVWARVAAGVSAAVLLLTIVGWGASALWKQGRGGEMEYREHNLAGNAASERGEFAKADDEYGQMIALRPRRASGYLLRAINEAQEGQPQAAIGDNTAALALTQEPETRGDLFYNRAESYGKQGKFGRAIADYTQANAEYLRERDPRLTSGIPDRREGVYSLRADAYWQRKQYALSIKDSKAAIALGPVHPDDYGVQAKAEAALGQDTAAQADFARALRLDPAYLDGYIGLANLAEKRHQYAQAASVYQKAVLAAPGNAQFWGSLGWFQYESGQNAQAVASDRHAQSLDPGQAWVAYNLGLTYAVMGRSAEAQAAYADAQANGAAADQKAGLADLRNALRKQPGSATLRLALAQVQRGSTHGPRLARAGPPAPAPVFSAPPAPPARFAALLAPEFVLADGYAVQPPAGYTLTQRREVTLSSGSTVYSWSGPRRADGTAAMLEVSVGRDDGSLAAHSTQLQVTQDALTDMASNHTNLRLSAVSAVTLGGASFDWGDWDGIGLRTGKEYKGREYWSVTPSHLLHLTSHDAFPYSRATLPLLNASLQTFRRRE